MLFDFDGTLSLIRSGWMNVMVPMMVEILADLKTGESEEQLRAMVEEFVWRLTGKETIYQMIAFAEADRSARRQAAGAARVQENVSRPAVAEDRSPHRVAAERSSRSRRNIWCRGRGELLER